MRLDLRLSWCFAMGSGEEQGLGVRHKYLNDCSGTLISGIRACGRIWPAFCMASASILARCTHQVGEPGLLFSQISTPG